MTEQKPKRRYFRKKIGMVFRIPLNENNAYAYGQVATETRNIFFDHQDVENQWTSIENILQKPVIFVATVDRYVLKEGLWEVLGVWLVDPKNQEYPETVGYDTLKQTYFFWRNNPEKGKVDQVPCSLEDIEGHEFLASYGHGSVEQRLRDHFDGRPNYDFVRQRMTHIHQRKGYMSRKNFYKQYGYNFHWLDDA